MAEIVCICTYPVPIPRHGGQIRVNAIEQVYRAAGYEVRHMAIYVDNFYPDESPSPWNIHFTPPFVNDLIATKERDDVNAPDFLSNKADVAGGKTLREQITALRKAMLVYSSQNVEYVLLQDVACEGEAGVSSRVLDLVRRMETDLVRNADLVTAYGTADADIYRSAARQVVLAPNGL